jgi:putative lipoic acid-binding regulatory protein
MGSRNQQHTLKVSASSFFISCLLLASSAGAFVISSKQLPLFCKYNPSRSFPAAMSMSNNEEDGEMPVSGSFFNPVPPAAASGGEEPTESKNNDDMLIENSASFSASFSGDDMEMFQQIIQKTTLSRGGGGKGFSKTTSTTDHAAPSVIQTTSKDSSGQKKSFVGIGKPLNDVQNPEYDENGYTLYADETTGEKKRVFEALVEYPSIFKMKIVGQDDEKESFAPEIVEIVAKSCGVEESMVKHSLRKNGKWTSVTVHAPVQSADMLYSLYENVDKNPRVKFKF